VLRSQIMEKQYESRLCRQHDAQQLDLGLCLWIEAAKQLGSECLCMVQGRDGEVTAEPVLLLGPEMQIQYSITDVSIR
jgi:hypothetical protein